MKKIIFALGAIINSIAISVYIFQGMINLGMGGLWTVAICLISIMFWLLIFKYFGKLIKIIND